ncbi:MAG: HyaD/HybD family hydrogenase maturation endopeptidase [Desulfobacterales bacterium]|jgi:hydrogenase maturation protease
MRQKQILVLGVGNILLKDDGIGVRIVEKLQQEYAFSPNVRLLDGGTLGLRLLEPITGADVLIVVDAIISGQPPGTIERLPLAVLRKRISIKNSLHQLDLLETLAHAEFLERLSKTTIIGIEPEDTCSLSLELTDTVRARREDMVSAVLEEIFRAGGGYYPRAPVSLISGTGRPSHDVKPTAPTK